MFFQEVNVAEYRRPMWAPFGNQDWHRQLLHFSRIARADTDSPVLIQQLEVLEKLLAERDECDRCLTFRFEIPSFIQPDELASELDSERVTYRFPDSKTIELAVCNRGSKSHLEELAQYAFNRCIGLLRARKIQM